MTAMQDLIQVLHQNRNAFPDNGYNKGIRAGLMNAIKCAENRLDLEKEILISMCNIGSTNPGIDGKEVYKTRFPK